MTTWVIISWVVVVILTAINIFVFMKLYPVFKQAQEMQKLMGMSGMGNLPIKRGKGKSKGMQPFMQGRGPSPQQIKAAQDMLARMSKKS